VTPIPDPPSVSPAPTRLVGPADVRAAAQLLEGIARRTPVLASRVLAEAVGGPVLLKCENLQRTGSFKLRGAYVRLARLPAAERARGVLAASAGNHAQGVALAGALLGIPVTVFMPERAPLPKVEATLGYGATVELVGSTVDEALAAAETRAAEQGVPLIHPFDHPDIIAGQGTVGLEVLEQCPDVATIVVCAGGGGLVSGIAAAVKGVRPDVRVVAVQAAGAASLQAALQAGRPVALPGMATMADGIAVGRAGDLTFTHVRALVDDVVTVSEQELSRGLLLCLERAKLVVEPAGVAAVAAVLARPTEFRAPVVAVVSGGNIDPLLLDRLLRHGLVVSGRYLSLRVTLPDSPGSLARLLDVVAATGANLLDVTHTRTSAGLGFAEVVVSLQAETRGPDHRAAVLAAIEGAGYAVTDTSGGLAGGVSP
jgi:threonine dehydratase